MLASLRMSSYAEIYREHSHQLTCQPTGVSPALKVFQGIKAVIFDIYGTLFISGSGDIGLNAAQPREEVLRSILKEQLRVDLPTNEPLTQLLGDSIKAEHLLMQADGVDYPEIDIRDHWRELLAPYGTFTCNQIETIAVHLSLIHI